MLTFLEPDQAVDALFGNRLGLNLGPDVLEGQSDLTGDVAAVAELDSVKSLLVADEALERIEDLSIVEHRAGNVHLHIVGLALGVCSDKESHLSDNLRVVGLELRERTGSTQLSS